MSVLIDITKENTVSNPDNETPENPNLGATQNQQQALDPNKPVFFLVPQPLLQEVIKRLGKLPAKKVFQTLAQLNQCQPIQPDDKPEQ